MKLYRFAFKKYKDDISGAGAGLFGGRWNSKGLMALYASESVSLALLEVLAHNIQYNDLAEEYLLTLETPDTTGMTVISTTRLKEGWVSEIPYTRFIGDTFLKENERLLLKIPSVIVPDEYNFLVNPLHRDAGKIKIISAKPFRFDTRLFLKNVNE